MIAELTITVQATRIRGRVYHRSGQPVYVVYIWFTFNGEAARRPERIVVDPDTVNET